jgi:hypothetical protein
MCVLCDKENLRILVGPLTGMGHRELAEAIAVAREAAWQLVLDTADGFAEADAVDGSSAIGPESYIDYVVERAHREDILTPGGLAAWSADLDDGSILSDPRVQSFLSSAAEGLCTYILQIRDHQNALELFLEERNGGVTFAGVGASGETVFDRGTDRFVVLGDAEAMRIAMDGVVNGLCQEDPKWLLEYTNLPPGAADVLAAMQDGPPERANDILAGIVDLQALTEDRVRELGYAPFVAEGVTEEFSEQRFGDRIIIRMRLPHESRLD